MMPLDVYKRQLLPFIQKLWCCVKRIWQKKNTKNWQRQLSDYAKRRGPVSYTHLILVVEHEHILAAIKIRNIAEAKNAAREHIDNQDVYKRQASYKTKRAFSSRIDFDHTYHLSLIHI